jgi:hypothetical protein
MAKQDKPQTPKEIANKVALNFSSCMMHLLGLKKAGYVTSPSKGFYRITGSGRDALKPKLGKDEALYLLSPVAREKAFHFYTGLHQYTGIHATGLCDFSEKIRHIDPKSIEFHYARKDFDRWFESLGDHELAKQLGSIQDKDTSGEKLRRLIYEITKARCDELTRLTQTA